MGYDITDLEQLIERNGNLTSFAAIQALQYLKTNGVSTNGIHDLKDLVLQLKLFEGRELAIEEAEGKAMEMVKDLPEGEMINPMLLEQLVNAAAKANNLDAKTTEELRKRIEEYVNGFGAVKKVDNFVDKLVDETIEEIKTKDPNIKEETISGIKNVTRIVLNNTLIDEAEKEEEPLRVLDEGTKKLAEAEKSLIDPQINLLKEAKKEIILHVEEETGNKVEKKDIEKLFEKSGIEEAQKVMAEEAEVFGDRNIFKIIQTGIKDYYNKKNEAERQITEQVAAELIEHDIPDAEKNKFATLILRNINGATLNDKEKKFIGEIDSVIENNYHTVLYGLIEYEFRTNLALIENEADFAEKIYMRLLQRADVKTKPGLMRILMSHRFEILHMIVMQVKAYKGYKEAPAQVKGIDPETAKMLDIMLRKNELLMKEFKEKNPELIDLVQKTKMKEVLTKVASEKIDKPTVEEKVAIRNFSEFTAQTYHPTRKQDQELRVARWMAEYEKRKQAVMQTRGRMPYKIPIVRQMNNLVEYIKSRPFFQYRAPFLRYNIPFVQPHYNMGQILRNMWTDMGQSFQSGYSQPGGLYQTGPIFTGGGGGRTPSIPQMINNFGNQAGPAMKGGANNVMKNLGVGPNALGRGLQGLGKGLGEGAMNLAGGLGKLGAAAFNPVTIQVIGIIVVVLIVVLLLYQIFTGNLISSLAPDTAYGGQISKDDPTLLTPTPTTGGGGFSPSPNCDASNKCPCGWPIRKGRVSQGFFGTCSHEKNAGFYYYPPLDISGERGEPVYATHDGMAECGSDILALNRMGNYVQICGTGCEGKDKRFCTQYLHLLAERPADVCGKIVTRGQLIGYLGCTGSAGWSVCDLHVHYTLVYLGIKSDGASYDYDYLNKFFPEPVPFNCCDNCGIPIDASKEPTATPKPTTTPVTNINGPF